MKKIKNLLLAFLMVLLVIPVAVNAEGEETAERSKIPVYMFRGEGCSVCANTLSFFDSIQEEYGKYFELITYEVWNDASNAELLNQMADYLGTKITGVPFIMIGEKTYPGFLDSMGDEIKQQIVTEYNRSDEERTDLLKNMQNGVEPKKTNDDLIITIVGLVVVAAVVTFLVLARKNNKKEATNKNETKEDARVEEEIVEIEEKKTARKSTKEEKTTKKKSSKSTTKKKPATKSKKSKNEEK